MPNSHRLASVVAVVLSAAMTGCGVGQGISTAPGNDLLGDIALSVTDYMILDLSTGAVTTSTAIPDLRTNAAYKDQLMVFRRDARTGVADLQ